MEEEKEGIYLIGAFTNPDWREDFTLKFPNLNWKDPKNNPQSSMSKTVYTDMKSSMESPSSIVYIPKGRTSAGTTSYGELGGARAMGNAIITIDESEMEKERILEDISSYYFSDKEEAYSLLEKEPIISKHSKVIPRNNPFEKENYENVYVEGNVLGITKQIVKLKNKGKKIEHGLKVNQLEKFSQTDLMIVNFDKGKNYDNKKALYFMGVAYALDIPVILVDENPANYPTLPALSRRTFHDENRIERLDFYLDRLESLKIGDEALVYYELMKKFNKI
ncbi:MAG: hypothetical protein Q8Q04_01265 [archaeon]|nr:hypothetical protein [archaeon]